MKVGVWLVAKTGRGLTPDKGHIKEINPPKGISHTLLPQSSG